MLSPSYFDGKSLKKSSLTDPVYPLFLCFLYYIFGAQNSSCFSSYAYVLILIAGLIGLIRYYQVEQRSIVLTLLGAVVFLPFLSKFEIRFRVPLEPLLIIYTAILVSGTSAIACTPSDNTDIPGPERRIPASA